MNMPNTPVGDVAEMLRQAAEQGRIVMVMPDQRCVPLGEPPLIVNLSAIFGLTRSEGRALARLLEHDHASKEQLRLAMGSGPASIKTVDVIVCTLRRKLAPHGIAIATIPRTGYLLIESAREKLREMLAVHDAKLTRPPAA